jgi:two-component system response regulator RegA
MKQSTLSSTGTPERGRVLVVDEDQPFTEAISRTLRDCEMSVMTAATFRDAMSAIDASRPDWVISELRIRGEGVGEFIEAVKSRIPAERVIVATVFPSVAMAVHLIKRGVGGYLTKPVSRLALMALFEGCTSPPFDVEGVTEWPSLDRTIWEYLSQVFVAAGSMSEAARRLGLDRRSLRRMLSKQPPGR